MISVSAQSMDVSCLAGKYHNEPAEHWHGHIKEGSSEFQYLGGALFWFYKNFISSQDYNKCGFEPTCSEYGVLAVKKRGLFIGIISTFDRLQRCNGFSPDLYDRDPATGRLADPV